MYIRKGCNKTGFLSDRLGFFLFDFVFCQTPVLGLGLGVDFTFAWGNNNNDNNDKNNDNPPLNFMKGTVLGDKKQGVGIRDNGKGIKGRT